MAILDWLRECPVKEVALVGKAVPTCIAAIFTALSKAEDAGVFHAFARDHILSIVMVCAITVLLSTFAEAYLGGSRKTRKRILDDLHGELFGGKSNAFQDNRVTLYRRKAGMLFPDCRAGTLYLTGITRFKIDDDHPTRNEGVAGQIWASKAFENVGPLPEYAKDKTKYMKACNLKDAAMAEKFKFHARSICGTVVLNARNEEWGVLVIDSLSPTGVGAVSAKSLTPALRCLKYVL